MNNKLDLNLLQSTKKCTCGTTLIIKLVPIGNEIAINSYYCSKCNKSFLRSEK